MAVLLEQKLTWREFREMEFPDDDLFIYELLNGELVKKQAPAPPHQEAVLEMASAMKNFVKPSGLGRVFPAPTDVFFDEHNAVQPDISFVSKERDFIVNAKDGILGAPDLIVEVISPGSLRRDRVVKKDLYERFAVKEYWLVDPNNRSVEIYVMRENAYVLHQFLELEGKASSTVLAGFEIEISALFA